MKRIVLALTLFLAPSLASAQCSGVFSNNTVCGNATGSSNTPRMTAAGLLPAGNIIVGTTTITGGTDKGLIFDDAGKVGNAALGTADQLFGVNHAGTNFNYFTLGGDATLASNNLTFNTVNSNVGTFGSSTAIPVLTVNGKGLITAVTTAGLPGSFSGFANPTASVGLTAVNGVATTAMRSDAAPPIDQSITPTWLGLHTFNAGISVGDYGYFSGTQMHYTNAAGVPTTAVNQGPMTLENGGPQLTWHETDMTAYATGTAQAGSATTITLAAGASAITNFTEYVGATVTITSGTGSGQVRSIASYVGTTKIATISGSNFSPAPDNTSHYAIGRCDYGWNRYVADNNFIFHEVWESTNPLTCSDGPFGQQDEWVRFNRWIHNTSFNYPITGNGNRAWWFSANYVWDGEAAQTPQLMEWYALNAGTNLQQLALTLTPNNTTPYFTYAPGVNWQQSGSASGVISFNTAAAAGTYNWNWPITAGTAGQCLVSQGGVATAMTWGACSGGGGTPAGSDTQVQFNNSGAFGASANFVWDGTGLNLGISGTLGYAKFGNATSGTVKVQPVTGALGTVTLSLPAATDTLVGKATTDILTNKTFDTAGTGNSFSINGVAVTANTGTGAVARASSPAFTTPDIGVATATSVNKVAITAPATSATLIIADGTTLTETTSTSIGRGQYLGTNTNDSATAGNIGEYITTVVPHTSSTVTISNASPGIVSWTSHPLNIGSGLNFTTTGGLPTGLTVGTPYYVCTTSFGANSFAVATSVANALAGTCVNTSSAGSGTHTANPGVILTAGTPINVAGISLTAGDWRVCISAGFYGGVTTTATYLKGSLSATTGTFNTTVGQYVIIPSFNSTPFAQDDVIVPSCSSRISLASTTTYFLVSQMSFATSTANAFGGIFAFRER